MQYLNQSEWLEDNSGLMVSKNSAINTAFSDEQQNNLLELEQDSWWFQYRAEVIIKLMKKFFDPDKLTLDIGAGNGYTSMQAQRHGFKMGIIEPSKAACNNALRRGIKEVNCGTVTDTSINDNSISQVLLLDVVEHIEYDNEFIALINRKITCTGGGGLVLITVPAFNILWSSEDDSAGHFRRYRLKELSKLLESNGFTICYKNYFMSFLFVPILIVRVLLEKIGFIKKRSERSQSEQDRIAKSQFKSPNKIINFALKSLEKFEGLLMRKSNIIPFGSSIILVAVKK